MWIYCRFHALCTLGTYWCFASKYCMSVIYEGESSSLSPDAVGLLGMKKKDATLK